MSAPARPKPAVPMDARIRKRRREVERQRARRRRRILLSVAGLLVIAAGVVAAAASPLFHLEEVRVVGVDEGRADGVRAATALVTGQNILTADLDDVAERVTELPWVLGADVRRVPPATIEVDVAARLPAAVVRLADTTWVLDADLVVLEGGEVEGLPVVDAPDSVLPPVGGTVSDAAVRNALDVWEELPADLRTRTDRLAAVSAREVRLRVSTPTDEQVWVRFGDADRAADKVQVIDLLLEQAQAQAERRAGEDGEAPSLGVAQLDVRAPDNPVLIPDSGS